LERSSRLRNRAAAGRLVVALRDVVALHENFTVVRDLDLHAADRRADGALGRVERMIERDDGRGFGEAVTLHDEKAELAPERFEFRIERRRAADAAPELPPEHAMNFAVPPPSPDERLAFERILLRRERIDALYVLAQHVEDLRDRDQHRDSSRLDLPDDLHRVVAVRENYRATNHRRHERRHGLPEHMTERQQIQKPHRMERPLVALVLPDLAFDGDDVREKVLV